MNWGLALLSLVILYAVTRDRWRWRRIVLGAVGLLVAGVAGFALLLWGMDRKDERERLEARVARAERLRMVVGGDKDDALIRLGPPDSIEGGTVVFPTQFINRPLQELEGSYLEHAGADPTSVLDSIAKWYEPERWRYTSPNGDALQAISFRGDTVTSLVFVGARGHPNEWTPPDGFVLGSHVPIDDPSLDDSCDVRTFDEFQVHLVPGDSIASRFVRIGHGSRRVQMHGWAYGGCPSPGEAGTGEGS